LYNKIKIQLSLLFVMILFSSETFSFDGRPSIRFKHLTIEDGLPQNSVHTMMQDSIGFLWFGTRDGLVRYDGYNLKTFKHEANNADSLSDNYILIIVESSLGNLWIGTKDGGLNHFNTQNEKFSRYLHQADDSNSISNNTVDSIVEDSQGNLWIGTRGGGLNHFNTKTKQFSHYRHQPDESNSLSHDTVKIIIEDNQRNLWIGTSGGGLNHFNTKTKQFSQYRHQAEVSNSLSHDYVRSILEDSRGDLWIGTEGGGLNHLNTRNSKFIQYRHQAEVPNSLSHDYVMSIMEDSRNNLWIGTRGGGLNYFEIKKSEFTHYRHQVGEPNSLSDDSIFSIMKDNQGNLWIGTRGGGTSHFNKKSGQFGHHERHVDKVNSLSHNSVWAFMEDNVGKLWIGTNDGLNSLDKKSKIFTHYRHQASDKNSLSYKGISDIDKDGKGGIWLGVYGGGLNHFNPKTKQFVHYRHQENVPISLSHDTVWSIMMDKHSNLWVGTSNGLNHFNTTNKFFTRYVHNNNDSNSLSDNSIESIIEDSQGNLWIGTGGGGLNYFDVKSGLFTNYRHQTNNPNSISHDTVYSIVESSPGVLLVGTRNGLNLFNTKTIDFKHYTTKDGLPNNVIYSIEVDNQGDVWLSTNQGLSRFNPNTQKFKNYDVGDGLQSNEFNPGSSFKSKNGELFFGGINGFNRFYPENITDDKQVPVVLITDILLLNESVPITSNHNPILEQNTETKSLISTSSINADDEVAGFSLNKAIHETKAITLTYKDNIISFEFAALHFSNPKKNQFAYQLAGWDKYWVTTDYKNRRATYTNLPDGDYIFKVKASNADGYWNETGTSLNITILPPPWKAWWAYTLYGLFLLGLIYAFIHSQRKKVIFERNVNAQLEHKVTERTSELKAKNQKIESQKHEVEEKNKEILETQKQLIQSSKMASIGTMTAGVAHEINNPTNFVHAAVYMMNDEVSEIKAFLKQLAGGDNAEPEVLQSFDDKFTKLVELTKTATEGTTRIKTIVEDLRTFARIDDAKQALVQVSDLINSTVHLVRTQYDSALIETKLDYDPLITCFPSKLNQVFMNIIINACQAIESKKASISKVEGKVQIKTEQHDKRLIITFEDNGCGMTEQTLNRIFEPFYTTKDVGSGTGLGMAITFGIIDEHGGSIDVESVVDKGTKITIGFDV